jgi:hypothetical protein
MSSRLSNEPERQPDSPFAESVAGARKAAARARATALAITESETPPSTGLPARLEKLADRAREYAKAASSANTRRAYEADWRKFMTWCERENLPPLPPDPQIVGLYITACASGAATADRRPRTVTTIERALSALTWHYTQLGQPLDRRDRHIATVLAGIRNTHAQPPVQKEAVLPPLPPDSQIVGLYITACASGAATADRRPRTVTMKNRLSDYAATAGQYVDRAREGLSAGSDQISKHAQSAGQNATETIRSSRC